MEDQIGVLVGRVFFGICALISLLGAFRPKYFLTDILKFIKKYQFKNISDQPTELQIKISRIFHIIFFIVFLLLIAYLPNL